MSLGGNPPKSTKATPVLDDQIVAGIRLYVDQLRASVPDTMGASMARLLDHALAVDHANRIIQGGQREGGGALWPKDHKAE